jgi:hypothetical protein
MRVPMALSVLAAVAVLTSCVGGGSQSFLAGTAQPDHLSSRPPADADSTGTLVFEANSNFLSGKVYLSVLSWPSLRLKKKSTIDEPAGIGLGSECTDGKGDVYVTVPDFTTSQPDYILEYSHDGTLLNSYTDTNGVPNGCAVNPVNGDLAVANSITYCGYSCYSGGSIDIYSSASSPPQILFDPDEYDYFFVGYNPSGDLWEDGSNVNGAFVLASCGEQSCKTIDVSGGTIHNPGVVQWDQRRKTWVVFDEKCDQTSSSYNAFGACSYPVSGSGVLGSRTTYDNYEGTKVCEMPQSVITPDGKHVVGGDFELFCAAGANTTVSVWSYPAGGKPIKSYVESYASSPSGTAISENN